MWREGLSTLEAPKDQRRLIGSGVTLDAYTSHCTFWYSALLGSTEWHILWLYPWSVGPIPKCNTLRSKILVKTFWLHAALFCFAVTNLGEIKTNERTSPAAGIFLWMTSQSYFPCQNNCLVFFLKIIAREETNMFTF